MNDFKLIYEKYKQYIYLFIRKLVNYNEQLAEELTQETFYQAFLSSKNYKGNCKIETWLCSIAKNTCFKYFRKNPPCISTDSDDFSEKLLGSTSKSLENYIEDRELSKLILEHILK